MAGPKLAETIAATGPDDKLIVVDVYEKEGSSVVNSYQETHPEAIDVLDTAKGTSQDGGGEEGGDDPLGDFIDQFTGDDSGGLNNDISDLTGLDPSTDYGLDSIEELAASNDDLLSDMSDLSDSIVNSFAIPGVVVPEIFSQSGDILSRLRSGIGNQSLNALTNMINQLSGGLFPTSILNNSGMGGLIAGVTNAASRIGIPGSFSAIARGINNQSVMDIALRTVLPDVVKRANIPLLNDIANTPLVRSVQNLIPGVIGETVRNLSRPTYLNQDGYANYYGETRQTFGRIDPNWNRDTRYDNGTVLNGTVVSSNPFYYDTAQANVMYSPINVSLNPDSDARANPSLVEYSRANDTVFVNDGESQVMYETRAAQQQMEDRAMYVAGSLIKDKVTSTVASYLNKEFRNVGAIVNRSMFA
jgi:hypothetical protein